MSRLLSRLFFVPVLLLVFGCSLSEPEPDLSAIVGIATIFRFRLSPERLEFDFGSVIARDQTLRHEFRVTNRSNRPLKILGSKVNVPCCSGLGKLPESIVAGGSTTVNVYLKAGHAEEKKRVSFEVETDSTTLPIRTLILTARLLPEWMVEDQSGNPGPLKIRETLTKRYRVIGRRKAGEGSRAPSVIEASGALKVESVSTANELENSDGVIESSREFVVSLTSQPDSGEKLGSLHFRWPDGATRDHQVGWLVKPSLQMVPFALVLKSEPALVDALVEIRSDDRAFRVLSVSGNLVRENLAGSTQASTVQSLRIPVDLTRVVPGVKPVIEIATDHPDQPKLILGILVLPLEKRRTE